MPEARKGLNRSFKIDREKLDADKRTIELAFSSETPVERWGENEVLSHEKGDYDFSRLNADHPLLLGHNEYNPLSQIGVVESAQVDGDKVGRAVVRFSKSDLGEQIFNDVKDGIRKLVSVGYDHTGIVSSEKNKNGRMTTRYRWQPTHIAIVPVPADTKVGVGREKEVDSLSELSADEIAQNLTVEQKTRMRILLDAAPAAGGGGTAVVVDEAKVRKEAADGYKARAKEITTIADLLIKDHGAKDGGAMAGKIRGMANEALQADETISDFKVRCMTEVLNAKPATPVMLEDCTDDPAQYSIQRGIQSAVRARERGAAGIPDGREGEVHQEILRRAKEFGGLGYDAQGFQVPHNATLGGSKIARHERQRMTRDSQATIFSAGGAMVATALVIPVIELLRNRMVLEASGILRTMSGLQGNIVIPRQEAAATAFSVSEIGALTASQQILGQIALSPKRVGSTQNYSKQLVMQSTPDAEAFIRDDHFKVIALQWDRLGLNGQGAASEPLGIMNTPGVGSIVFGATPTYIQIVRMETDIRSANVTDDLVYLSTPSTKGSLKTVAEALTGATTIGGSQNAIWKGRGMDGEVNGYTAMDTNQIPGNKILLCAKGQCIQALWGGLDIVVDIYTKAVNAEIAITFNTWGDFAVRHPQAFEVSADAGNQ